VFAFFGATTCVRRKSACGLCENGERPTAHIRVVLRPFIWRFLRWEWALDVHLAEFNYERRRRGRQSGNLAGS